MNLTPRELTARENAILDALEHSAADRTFLGKLYRDGVPTPASYLKQPVRVLFAFREPNMRGVPYALDMRDEVRERPLVRGHRGALRRVRMSCMQIASGKVVDGHVELDGELPEGTSVTVLARDEEEGVSLTPEEEAELLLAIAEADRGETVSAEEVISKLARRHG